jgi:hypothetical protein
MPQVKVVYDSGFDFTSDIDIVNQLKEILSAIVRLLLENKASSSGINSYMLDGFYKVDYDSNSTSSLLSAYLSAIKKYAG